MRLLSAAGYSPSIDKCVICGSKPRGSSVFFSFSDGGILCSCSDTRDKFGFRVSPGSLMVMKSIMAEKIENLSRLKIGVKQGAEIEKIILQFLSYHSGTSKPPKSLAFLRKIEGNDRK